MKSLKKSLGASTSHCNRALLLTRRLLHLRRRCAVASTAGVLGLASSLTFSISRQASSWYLHMLTDCLLRCEMRAELKSSLSPLSKVPICLAPRCPSVHALFSFTSKDLEGRQSTQVATSSWQYSCSSVDSQSRTAGTWSHL